MAPKIIKDEQKLTLLANYMILYAENPKEYTKYKIRVNKFSKILR
jgi:hypothetical protein